MQHTTIRLLRTSEKQRPEQQRRVNFHRVRAQCCKKRLQSAGSLLFDFLRKAQKLYRARISASGRPYTRIAAALCAMESFLRSWKKAGKMMPASNDKHLPQSATSVLIRKSTKHCCGHQEIDSLHASVSSKVFDHAKQPCATVKQPRTSRQTPQRHHR